MKSTKTLFIIRGVPGSGKTSLAESLGGIYFEADKFFMINGEYKFDYTKLKQAHDLCRHSTEAAMSLGHERVIVSNTFTTEEQMYPYLDLAKDYGYRVVSLIVENRHGNKSIHDVPEETLVAMESKLKNSIKLR
jgi:predicted kinase